MNLPPIRPTQAPVSQTGTQERLATLDIQRLGIGTKLAAIVEYVQKLDTASLLKTQSSAPNQHLGGLLQALQQHKYTQTKDLNIAEGQIRANNTGLQSPNNRNDPLYLARLQVLGKKVVVLSQVTLYTAQKVTIAKQADGRLQVIAPDNTRSAVNTSPVQGPVADKMAGSSAGVHNIINSALRQHLPGQRSIAAIASQLSSVPPSSGTSLPPGIHQVTQLAQTLKSLSTLSIDAKVLSSPEQLRQSIYNSGSFLESKIAASITSRGSNIAPNNAPAGQLNTTDQSPLVPPKQMQAQRPSLAPGTPLLDSIASDTKAELLRALHFLNGLSDSLPSPTVPVKPSDSDLAKLLDSLFALFRFGPREQRAHAKQLSQKIAQQLQGILQSGIARITTLQLQQLSAHKQEGNVIGPSAQIELPVKMGDTVYPLQIHIQERYERDPSEGGKPSPNEQASQTLQKRWQVFLEFDLGELGHFASDIVVNESQVNTSLWIEKMPLWSASKQHLHQLKEELEKSGVSVEELICTLGKVNKKANNLKQTLVDIRT